jgi:hypothetical protein
LMVGVAIGLVVIAVMLQGFAASSSTTRVNSLVSEYQTNGRYALELLKRELRHSALHPMVWPTSSADPQVSENATAKTKDFGCGAGVSTDVMNGITAWNDSNPYPALCLATAGDRQYARGDVLMLRRAALDEATAVDAGAPYLRVAYSIGNVYLGGDAVIPMQVPFFDYRLVSDVYFINDFTTSNTEDPKVPALYRLTLSAGANPTMVPELVASNVEHFEVQFGVLDAAGVLQYRNPAAAIDWTRVVSARIWLLLRATSPEGGFASGTYVMGDVNYTPADNFRRTVLTSTINLRNQ